MIVLLLLNQQEVHFTYWANSIHLFYDTREQVVVVGNWDGR